MNAAPTMKAMANLAELPNQWQPGKKQCKVIIETPKGRRNKFGYDPDSGLFQLRFLLPQGLLFPFDFGFIPSTLADDGDPLDIMVLMDEPAHVGCILDVRLIGVIEAVQTENGKRTVNDRLIGVAVNSYEHRDVKKLDQISSVILDQLEEFFTSYNRSRGKKFEVKRRQGPQGAAQLLEKACKAFENRK